MARGAGRAHELLTRQLVQGVLHLARITIAHRDERTRPEHLAHDGGVLQQALALGRERVQASGDQRLHRVRDVHLLFQLTPVRQQTHELLRVQRVPAGSLEQRPLRLRRQNRSFEQAADEAGRFLLGERERLIRCAFWAWAPNVGFRSYSSGRVVQRRRSGTSCAHPARCSRKERSASSAQCRSSKTSTVSRSSAHDSSTRRHAANVSSCEAGSPPAPTSGSRRALSQAKSGSRPGALGRASPPPPRACPSRGSRTRP